MAKVTIGKLRELPEIVPYFNSFSGLDESEYRINRTFHKQYEDMWNISDRGSFRDGLRSFSMSNDGNGHAIISVECGNDVRAIIESLAHHIVYDTPLITNTYTVIEYTTMTDNDGFAQYMRKIWLDSGRYLHESNYVLALRGGLYQEAIKYAISSLDKYPVFFKLFVLNHNMAATLEELTNIQLDAGRTVQANYASHYGIPYIQPVYSPPIYTVSGRIGICREKNSNILEFRRMRWFK